MHGNILQYERELVHLLQSLASTDFSIPLQVGAVLGISSPDKLVSKSALARKVSYVLTDMKCNLGRLLEYGIFGRGPKFCLTCDCVSQN